MTVAAMLNHPEFDKVGVASFWGTMTIIFTPVVGRNFPRRKQTWGKDGNRISECHIPTNIELADRLAGRLLLITGDMDNNVHPASTARLADALIRPQAFRLDGHSWSGSWSRELILCKSDPLLFYGTSSRVASAGDRYSQTQLMNNAYEANFAIFFCCSYLRRCCWRSR